MNNEYKTSDCCIDYHNRVLDVTVKSIMSNDDQVIDGTSTIT